MNPWVGLLAGATLPEAYERYTSPEFKSKLRGFTDAHHGELGVIAILAGLVTKSPALTTFGLGLAYHDRADANEWFSGKRRYNQ
jgi:hypothetical protein